MKTRVLKRSEKEKARYPRRLTLVLAGLALLLFLVPGGVLASRGERTASAVHLEKGRYVVNLLSDTAPLKASKIPYHKDFKGHTLYTTEYRSKKGVLWHRLRLGFFPTRKAAEEELKSLKGRFKTAWISRVSVSEKKKAHATVLKSVGVSAALDETGKKIAAKTLEAKAALGETGKKIADWGKKTYSGIDEHMREGLHGIEKKFKKKEGPSGRESRRSASKDTHSSTAKTSGKRGWKIGRVKIGKTESSGKFTFDHFKTGFPLDGAHVEEKCEACHPRGIFTNTPTHCSECHSQGAVVKATYKSIDHTRTNAPCDQCHVTNTWNLSRFNHPADTFGQCYSCHNGTTNAGKPAAHVASSNNCDDCHNTNTWLTARYDHSNITSPCATCHNGTTATGKPGSHIQTTAGCDDCHSTRAWIPAGFDHSNITGTCSSCHNGSTATGKPPGHVQTSSDCDDCHSTRAWIPAGFDHSNVTGTCSSCHNGSTATGKPPGHVQTSSDCDACHSTRGWIPASFDHSDVTGTCSSCHNGSTATGKPPDHVQTTSECDVCHSTRAWIPASFDHSGVTGTCSSCHNGSTATGKPPDHVQTNSECDVCHSTRAWIPASFDHSGVTGSCSSCHNGSTATGKPPGHFVTTQECNECHDTRGWIPVTTFHHNTPNYPGDHKSSVDCVDCHKNNNETISWDYPAYQPDCAACHSKKYKDGPHKKTKNPSTIYYTVSELRDCSGACHRYTDNTFTTIEKHKSNHHHSSDGGW